MHVYSSPWITYIRKSEVGVYNLSVTPYNVVVFTKF